MQFLKSSDFHRVPSVVLPMKLRYLAINILIFVPIFTARFRSFEDHTLCYPRGTSCMIGCLSSIALIPKHLCRRGGKMLDGRCRLESSGKQST